MNHRIMVAAAVGALGFAVAPVRADDLTSNLAQRAAQTLSQTLPQTPSPPPVVNHNAAQDFSTLAPPRQEPPDTTDHEAVSWTFDRALYTNDPKTGARVWQYAKKKPAYRDPYSFLDSPHDAYPFGPDAYYGPYYGPMMNYGLYPNYPYTHPYPDGPMPYTPAE